MSSKWKPVVMNIFMCCMWVISVNLFCLFTEEQKRSLNYQIYCVESSRTCACDLNMGVVFHMRWALFEHFFVLHLVLFKFSVHLVFSCSAEFDLATLFNISAFRTLVITETKTSRKEHIKQSQLVLSSVWNIFWVCGQVAPLTSSSS